MIESALRRLFAENCAVAVRSASRDVESLPSVEAEAVSGAVLKRRQEFTAGREAAREALRALGFVDPVIPSGEDRAPRWPDGAVGSIAHAEGRAVAVAAKSREILALGVDLERTGGVGENLWPQIFQPGEIARLENFPAAERTRWATVAFCAKEAFYKFQYPLTLAWRGFADVDVDVEPQAERVRIGTRDGVRVDSTAMYNFEGGFALDETFTLVGLYLPVSFARKAG